MPGMLTRPSLGVIVATSTKIGARTNYRSAGSIYATQPFTRTRNEVPAYIYSGGLLPQQDEIKAIEVELNWRYDHGDKTAELKEFWPSTRRHIASGARLETL